MRFTLTRRADVVKNGAGSRAPGGVSGASTESDTVPGQSMASVLTPYGIDGASTGRQPARLGCGATLRASSSAPRQSTRSGRTRLPWDPARARRPPGPSAERARSLFEEAVGAQAKRVRNREAKRLCGLEIDDQLEARRPFDRQVGRLGALEDPGDEERCPPVEIALPRAVGH